MINYFNKCVIKAIEKFSEEYPNINIISIENKWSSSNTKEEYLDNTTVVIKGASLFHFETIEKEYYFENKLTKKRLINNE